MGLVVLGLQQSASWGWSSVATWVCIVAGVALGVAFVRWELRALGDGCLLVLTHSFADRFKAARDGAGWHVCLWWLSRQLDGAPSGRGDDVDGLPRGWRELNEEYLGRFDIPPEKATPPPSG